MSAFIRLSVEKPLFSGRKRAVYQHPQDSRLLIKIIRPETIDQRWGSGARWYKFKRRPGKYMNYHREVGEYICLRANNDRPSPAIQCISGFVETDLGLGLVVEKLVDENGNPAPTLKSLILHSGLTSDLKVEIERLVEELLRTGVIVSKLNTRNTLLAFDPEHGRRLVIIDGMGSKSVIPVYTLSKTANAYNTRRKADELVAEINKLIERGTREVTTKDQAAFS